MEPKQDKIDPRKVAEEALAFMKSPEGKRVYREAAKMPREFIDNLRRMRTLYPERMHIRFTI